MNSGGFEQYTKEALADQLRLFSFRCHCHCRNHDRISRDTTRMATFCSPWPRFFHLVDADRLFLYRKDLHRILHRLPAVRALRGCFTRRWKRRSSPVLHTSRRFTLPNMGVNQYILIGTNFHGQPRFGRNEFKRDGCATGSGTTMMEWFSHGYEPCHS